MSNRLDTINKFRATLDWLEEHPDVPLPYELSVFHGYQLFGATKADLRALISALPNVIKSEADHLDSVKVTGTPPGGIPVTFFAKRELTCDRKVVGTRKVMKPDPDADVPMVEVEEEIVEWDCRPLLGDR